MYHSSGISVKPYMKMAGLIDGNPYLLLMLQHFNIDFRVSDRTVMQLCDQYGISERLFVSIANLYNGAGGGGGEPPFTRKDLLQVIDFLKNSHNYYRFDKYPQISAYIRQLQENHPEKELKLLEKFFNGYFEEVREHLDYEDEVAFPYFIALLGSDQNHNNRRVYSSNEYSDHHTDIELKLNDLKNLLLKHIRIDDDLGIRRKLFMSLYELGFDLYIHSLIEETILIPSGADIERE